MSHLLLILAACSPDLTPSWAWDPIWLEPVDDGGVHGFETWQIYGPNWPSHQNDRNYVCAVVVELTGAPTACDEVDGCAFAWDVTVTPAQSDCAEGFDQDPLFQSLQRLGFGPPSTDPEAPWPGQTTEAYADYGNGWEVYGDGYPAALDDGGQAGSATWDGTEPYLLVPTSSFQITP
jgi:hypothetical protein